MKKNVALFISLALTLSITACGGEADSDSVDAVVTSTLQMESAENNEKERMQTESAENGESVLTENNSPDNSQNESAEMTDADITLVTIDEFIEQDVADSIASMEAEYEAFIAEIDTYDKYVGNVESVETYYTKVCEDNRQVCIKMCEYGILYAELSMASDVDRDDKYDICEGIYDCIYEDAFDEIYDGIYDDLFDEIYDGIYDGVLDDGYDTAPYGEWYDTCSEEYERWYDNKSDVYEEWYDIRSELYEFYSDLRSEIYGDDTEEVYEVIADFKEYVEEMKEKSASDSEDTTSEETENVTTDESEKEAIEPVETEDANTATDEVTTDTSSEETTTDSNGMRPEFKEAMDSYEAFYDEYCEFMKKYQENPTDLSLLAEYAKMVEKLTEEDEKFGKWADEDLRDEELKYYMEVTNRVSQKILESL